MGLGVNIDFEYDRFFAMIPTGTGPNWVLTEGFFETASKQTPRPTTVAIVAADAPFSKNPILGALGERRKERTWRRLAPRTSRVPAGSEI
jgi:branched-chain amino acid transport system substrate-binding protein